MSHHRRYGRSSPHNVTSFFRTQEAQYSAAGYDVPLNDGYKGGAVTLGNQLRLCSGAPPRLPPPLPSPPPILLPVPLPCTPWDPGSGGPEPSHQTPVYMRLRSCKTETTRRNYTILYCKLWTQAVASKSTSKFSQFFYTTNRLPVPL